MGLMKRVLRALVPQRLFGPNIIAVLDAIGSAIQSAYNYAAGTLREANPGTAVDMLPSWYRALGLKYDATLQLSTRQAIARQAYVSIGGPSPRQIEDALQIAFPDITIERVQYMPSQMVGVGMVGLMQVQDYPSWFTGSEDGTYPYAYYRVTGAVNDQQELTALTNLLERIQPAEMEPVTGDITIRNLTETAEVMLAMVGLAQVGRTKEDE